MAAVAMMARKASLGMRIAEGGNGKMVKGIRC